MKESYWTRVLTGRLSRRRALAVTGVTAAGAALLAACGGGSAKTSSGGDKSGLIATPVDTSKQAKRGAINKWFLTSEPADFDLHVGGNPKNNPKNLTVSNLVSEKPG